MASEVCVVIAVPLPTFGGTSPVGGRDVRQGLLGDCPPPRGERGSAVGEGAQGPAQDRVCVPDAPDSLGE
jgi:hypothetical protein